LKRLSHRVWGSSAPRGRSAPAETEISPESPERETAGGEAAETSAADADTATTDGATVGSEEMTGERDVEGGDATGTGTPTRTRTWTLNEVTESSEAGTDGTEPSPADGDAETAGTVGGAKPDPDGDRDWTAGGVAAPTDQRTLDGETATPDETFDRLPAMRVLGQYDETYVVAETPDGLVLVDQHAADERINYERLRAEMSGETPTQALAEPVELELTAREGELFGRFRDALAELGFHADRIDDRTVEVRTVPTVFDAALDPSLLRDALTGFAAGDAGETVDAVADSLLADLACYPSITGNTSLTEGSVVDLLDALDDCENPFACPHGRPVVVAFDRDEIADRFERDYPGHGGRRAE